MCTLEFFLEIFASILTNCLVTLLNIYARTFFRGRFLVFEKNWAPSSMSTDKIDSKPRNSLLAPSNFWSQFRTPPLE